MSLFFSEKEGTPLKKDILRHPTPIGNLAFNLSFASQSLLQIPPQKTLRIENEIHISSWIFEECEVEFLQLNFHPRLPPDLQVESCLCGVWRVKAFSKGLTLKFDCYLESTKPSGIIGVPEFAEGIIARAWENDQVKLTIGTEGEDYLTGKAYLQMGQRRPSFKKENQPELLSYLKNGLRITLAELAQEDYVQIHFVAAWTSISHPPESTLYAVNQSPDQILKFCDIY